MLGISGFLNRAGKVVKWVNELRVWDDLINLFDRVIERSILFTLETPHILKSISYMDVIVFGEGVEL